MYVSNLGYNVSDNDLRKLFAAHGEVASAKIITDRDTGHSRGFGFVEMNNDAEAKKAMAALNDSAVDGHNIQVTEARPREERPSRNNSGGGYNSKRW